jgi:hypothetical protein
VNKETTAYLAHAWPGARRWIMWRQRAVMRHMDIYARNGRSLCPVQMGYRGVIAEPCRNNSGARRRDPQLNVLAASMGRPHAHTCVPTDRAEENATGNWHRSRVGAGVECEFCPGSQPPGVGTWAARFECTPRPDALISAKRNLSKEGTSQVTSRAAGGRWIVHINGPG